MSIDDLARMLQEHWAEVDRSNGRWLILSGVVLIFLAVVFAADKILP